MFGLQMQSGRNLVPVYFPTAGAGSGGLRLQVLPLSTSLRILPQECDRDLTKAPAQAREFSLG